MQSPEILELIREVGLAPTKAKNVSAMAHQILDDGGEVRPDWACPLAGRCPGARWWGEATAPAGSS